MTIPLEVAYKIAQNLCDVAAYEKLQDAIDEICDLVHQYHMSAHRIELEYIWRSLDFMINPALLNVSNAHDYFRGYHVLFINHTNPRLSEIGRKMLCGSC